MSIDVAVGEVDGQVIIKWEEPTKQIIFDPQNAYQVGEAMARAAHAAKHGTPAQSDESYIAEQARARATENVRARMINRVVMMLGSMERKRRTPAHIANQLVDAMLRELL